MLRPPLRWVLIRGLTVIFYMVPVVWIRSGGVGAHGIACLNLAGYDGHQWLAIVDLLIMTSYAVVDEKLKTGLCVTPSLIPPHPPHGFPHACLGPYHPVVQRFEVLKTLFLNSKSAQNRHRKRILN